MLVDYQKEQPIAYQILKNTIDNNKFSHAYLFETNGYYNSIPLVFSFVKELICPSVLNKNCLNCNICKMIDTGNYPEIKVIKPDGLWIKKEQLLEMMDEFNKKALVGNKKIYIIFEAEKLNKAAANSILKFLEEPEDNIIAILITENIYQMLETIKSRCQIISLKTSSNNITNNKNKINLILFSKEKIEEEKQEQIKNIVNFIKYYENNHLDTIVYMNKIWHNYVKTKDDFIMAFEILIMYYKDILNYLLNIPLEYFDNYLSDIKDIASKNTVLSICNKLRILIEYKEKIKFNMNTNLLMDKLVIELGR